VLIISNPINSTVPIAAEVLKRHGVFDPKRLFGVTTLDVLRANTFVADSQKWDPTHTDVTVVGGHAGITILPLLSQVTGAKFTKEQIEALTHRVQFGGDEVVKAKDGAGSATLSMAAAADRFVSSLLRAVGGATSVSECAFVQSPIVPGVPFFSTRIELGVSGGAWSGGLGGGDVSLVGWASRRPCLAVRVQKSGVTRIHPIGAMSDFEKAALDKMVPELKTSIDKGVKFAQAWKPAA
jgi:malate dehydrogenase